MNESVILECPGNTGKKCVGGNGEVKPSAGALSAAAADSGPIPVGLRATFHTERLFSGGCWYMLGTPIILVRTRLGGL